jgi:acid phosphatase type 7
MNQLPNHRGLSGLALVLFTASLLANSCGGSPSRPSGGATVPPARTQVLSGAGDIALCDSPGSAQTAALLDGLGGYVFTAGDNAYFQGTESDFRRCYDPTWGRHKSRTFATPGNHDYESPQAAPYFAYFGERAGPAGVGYYVFTLGNWTIASLNSNTEAVTFNGQAQWLRDTLQDTQPRCLAAIWHHPLVSSGPNGNSSRMRQVWAILQEFNAEFVITAHDHIYERFAPLNADGVPLPSGIGIREFVAGTGGGQIYQVHRVQPGSEFTYSGLGILSLKLEADSYSWQFVSAPDGMVRDSGFGACH